MRVGLLLGLLLALAAEAQLIPSGTPVPVTTLPPVVFINGFQFEGCPSTFAGTFGIADQVLQSNGEVSLFFSTCSLPSTASIEDLAGAFATFLGSSEIHQRPAGGNRGCGGPQHGWFGAAGVS